MSLIQTNDCDSLKNCDKFFIICNNKENMRYGLRKRQKEVQNVVEEEYLEKLLLESRDNNQKGFWKAKLRELELQKNCVVKKKNGLYDFSEDETSTLSFMKEKKRKKKHNQKKSEKAPVVNNKFSKQKKKLISNKTEKNFYEEKEKIADEEKKFTFSSCRGSIGLTSTPAFKKINVIEASDFKFMSPISTNRNVEYSKAKITQSKVLKIDYKNFTKKNEILNQKTRTQIVCKYNLRKRKLMQ